MNKKLFKKKKGEKVHIVHIFQVKQSESLRSRSRSPQPDKVQISDLILRRRKTRISTV